MIKSQQTTIVVCAEVLRSYSGHRVRLMCACEAVPAPEWTWYSPTGSAITIDGTKYIDKAPLDDPLV